MIRAAQSSPPGNSDAGTTFGHGVTRSQEGATPLESVSPRSRGKVLEPPGFSVRLQSSQGQVRRCPPVQPAKNHLLGIEDTARRRLDGVGAPAVGSSVRDPAALVCSAAVFPHTRTPTFCLAGFTRGPRSGDVETPLAQDAGVREDRRVTVTRDHTIPGLPEGSEATSGWEVGGGGSPMPPSSHTARERGCHAGSTCVGPAAAGGAGTWGRGLGFPSNCGQRDRRAGRAVGPWWCRTGQTPEAGETQDPTERGRSRWRQSSNARRRASLLEEPQSTDRAWSPPEGRE